MKVEGKVQGVFFRKSTLEKALELGVKGFVRNEPDGSVWIDAEGEEPKLKAFIEWVDHGPPAAEVRSVDLEENSLAGHTAFTIRY